MASMVMAYSFMAAGSVRMVPAMTRTEIVMAYIVMADGAGHDKDGNSYGLYSYGKMVPAMTRTEIVMAYIVMERWCRP